MPTEVNEALYIYFGGCRIRPAGTAKTSPRSRRRWKLHRRAESRNESREAGLCPGLGDLPGGEGGRLHSAHTPFWAESKHARATRDAAYEQARTRCRHP